MEALSTLIAGVPLDLGLTLALFAALLTYNYSLGKHRTVTLLTSLYISGAVVTLAPALSSLAAKMPIDAGVLPIITFALVLLLVYGVVYRSHFFDPYIVPSGWEIALFSLLHVIVIVVIVTALLPASVVSGFSPNFARIFMDPIIRSILVVSPLAVLAVLRGR